MIIDVHMYTRIRAHSSTLLEPIGLKQSMGASITSYTNAHACKIYIENVEVEIILSPSLEYCCSYLFRKYMRM